MDNREHPLSWEALSRIVLMGITVFLMWKALDVVIDVVVALVLAVSLYPVAHTVQKETKLSLLFSTLIVFFILLVPFFVLAFVVIPSFSSQFPELINNLNATINHIPFVSYLLHGFNVGDYIHTHASDIAASSATIVLTIISVVSIIVLSFYFIYDFERLLNLFLSIFPYREKPKLRGVLSEVAKVTGQYIRGNVIISLITTTVIFFGLLILRVPFALPLAIFAGIMDLLPLVGSTLGAIPALLVAFSLSPVQGFSVLILHLVYQQVENAIICPAIYNKALKLYPALGFLAVLLGASLFGILGAFLALPVAASIPVVMDYHENYKQRHQPTTS